MHAKNMSVSQLAQYIDYSVLKPEFNEEEIREQVQLAVDFGCKTVCVNPWSIEITKEIIANSDTKLCVVCDFPFGNSSPQSRLEQTKQILEEGSVFELDIVMNYGLLRSNKDEPLIEDLKAIADLCHQYQCELKVIFETDALTYEEIDRAIDICIQSGVDFIKTSTGFYTGTKMHGDRSGGFREMIKHMIEKAEAKVKVKASGAIRDREHFLDLIDMGVDRMGVGFASVPVVLGVSAKEAKALRGK